MTGTVSRMNFLKEIVAGIDDDWRGILVRDNSGLLVKIINTIPLDNICPHAGNIFNAMRLTRLNDIKCVIIGQDPYHTMELDGNGIMQPTAHGLAFSSKSRKIPPSLRNIYEALIKSGLLTEMPKTADLTHWATQGILLLNMALTTEVGNPEQHLEMWRDYVISVIKTIAVNATSAGRKLVFMLWGKKAQMLEEHCGDHYVWKHCHPSPKAQNGVPEERFVNCNHFSALQALHTIRWDPDVFVRIFTDGSATVVEPKNGGHAMLVVEGESNGFIKYGRTPTIGLNGDACEITNNRGEGLAIINAMEFVKSNDIRYPVEIVTDSQLYINIITLWMTEWHKLSPDFTKKKDGGPIANKDIVERLYELRRANITFQHINSHRTAPENVDSREYLLWWGNNVVDIYAKKAYDLEPGETVTGILP